MEIKIDVFSLLFHPVRQDKTRYMNEAFELHSSIFRFTGRTVSMGNGTPFLTGLDLNTLNLKTLVVKLLVTLTWHS